MEETRGWWTASKIKAFLLGPKYCKLKYVDEIVPKHVEENEEEKRHFTTGTALHRLFWMPSEDRTNMYVIGDGFLKKDLATKIVTRAVEAGESEEELKKLKKWANAQETKLEVLRQKWYGDEHILKEKRKIYLTPAEGRDIMGMYASVLRQDNWDL